MDPENNTTYSLFVSDADSKRLYSNDNDFGSALLKHTIQNNSAENEDIEPMEINLAENVQETPSVSLDNGKAKSFWGYNKTVSLIHAVEAHYDKLNHAKKRKRMCDNVSNELVSIGMSASSHSCNQKWRNLLRTHKSYKDNRKATGGGVMTFQFFEAMDGFMDDKPNSPHAVNVVSFIDNNEKVSADKEDDTEVL
ncbi:Myb/SANT-like DNA-binding domain [Popillia japonica]|uniref:Myb/SANT-like DNA-binding domain n=1 Tax=Popillia japonica TaxID=7064 RepID=A0AAW1LQ96_POPJA